MSVLLLIQVLKSLAGLPFSKGETQNLTIHNHGLRRSTYMGEAQHSIHSPGIFPSDSHNLTFPCEVLAVKKYFHHSLHMTSVDSFLSLEQIVAHTMVEHSYSNNNWPFSFLLPLLHIFFSRFCQLFLIPQQVNPPVFYAISAPSLLYSRLSIPLSLPPN